MLPRRRLPSWLIAALTACGPAAAPATSRSIAPIIGGTPDPGHPAVVVIEITVTAGDRYLCSGSLIAPRLVLTAGHCLEDAASARVGFGADRSSATWYAATELITHPNFQTISGEHPYVNDVALVRLEGQPAGVLPMAVLPSSLEVEQADVGGLPMELVGFGSTGGGAVGQDKEHVTKTMVFACTGTSECTWRYRTIHFAKVSTNVMCHRRDPAGTCNGDSGGPAIVTRSGQDYVAGISSFGDSSSCLEYGCHTIADRFHAFIDPYIAAATPADAGVADAGFPDAESRDAAAPDAAPEPDASQIADAEAPDATERPDATARDAAARADAGTTLADAAEPNDAGAPDAGNLSADAADAPTGNSGDAGGCTTAAGGATFAPLLPMFAVVGMLRRRRHAAVPRQETVDRRR